MELITRERSFDPLRQESILELRARLWMDDVMVGQEEQTIVLPAFFAQEVTLMLETTGFSDIEVQGRYTEGPASRRTPRWSSSPDDLRDDARFCVLAQRFPLSAEGSGRHTCRVPVQL